MDDMEIPDIRRDIVNTLISYKGIPHYVVNVNADKKLLISEVGSNESLLVDYQNISAITGRIGMTSDGEGCVYYIARYPTRKFFIGLNQGVMLFTRVYETKNTHYEGLTRIKGLTSKYLVEAIQNKYLPIREALKEAKNLKGAMPFDKQFAIDKASNIYYKTGDVVGKLPPASSTIYQIQLLKEFEYLQPLLENSCEKTVRTFKS